MVAGHLCAVVLHLLVYMKCLFWGHFAFLFSHFCIYSDSFSISLDNSAVGCTSLVVFVSLGGSLASGFGVLHLSKVDFVSLCGSFSGVLVDRFLRFTLGCEPEKTSSAVLVQEKEKGWKKKLSWSDSWLGLVSAAWLMMKWLERWAPDKERQRYGGAKRRRQKENKTKTGDREGEAETIRRMLSLHHYFNTRSPSTVSSSLFYYSRSLSSFSFYYSSSLFSSPSLVFISLSLLLSVVQTLRQMSHEIFAIKTQGEFSECVYVCGRQDVHMRVRVCVCVRSFWLWLWSLSGLLAALEGSPPVFFDPTSEIQKNNLAGTKSNWPLKIVNSLAAAQLTSQGERMFHGDRSQKIHEETRQEKMQKNGF